MSGFQLSFRLSSKSPLHTFFLLSGEVPLLFLRVVIVVTVNGTPEVIMDGVIEHHQIVPGNDVSHPSLVISGKDLTAVMNQKDFSGFPFPACPAEARVALLLAKYAFLGIVPIIDKVAQYVDQRIRVTDFRAEQTLTKDTVPSCEW